MQKLNYFSFVAFVFSLILEVPSLTAQQGSSGNSISALKTRIFLRQPDGIQKLSAEIGDVVLSDPEERWGEHDFDSLMKASDLIVSGSLLQSVSRLADDGDSLLTTYEVGNIKSLKGVAVAPLTFHVSGGQLKLSTGYMATLHTPTWDHLKIGDSYLFFLEKTTTGYRLAGASQGLLHVSDSDQTIHLIDQDPKHATNLRRQVEGLNRSSLEALIRYTALK